MKEEIERLIEELDQARAVGTIFTYGGVQQRLREILRNHS